MFFWFVGTAVVTVGFVFRDAAFDYRLLLVGSVLPIGDVVTGGVGPLHSLTVTVGLLAVVMLATSGRTPRRRLLLGLPIGMLLHLVFDAAWTQTDVFWWPFTGTALPDEPVPFLRRGAWSLLLEAVGVVICVWLWRANDLGNPARRHQFLRDGRLTVATPPAREHR
jgi:hypothetical protein